MKESDYIAHLRNLRRQVKNGSPLKDFVDSSVDEFAEDLIEYTINLYEERQRYRCALVKIKGDGVELSHEKIADQRNYFIKLAREAL